VLVRLLLGESPNITLGDRPDIAMLMFNFGAAIVCAVLFGVAPAGQGMRTGVATGLREGRTVASSRLLGRKLLLSGQTALSLLLLFGAALFLRSFHSISTLDLGFQSEQLVQVTLHLMSAGYKQEQVHGACP
jgi:hypothetical protein